MIGRLFESGAPVVNVKNCPNERKKGTRFQYLTIISHNNDCTSPYLLSKYMKTQVKLHSKKEAYQLKAPTLSFSSLRRLESKLHSLEKTKKIGQSNPQVLWRHLQ